MSERRMFHASVVESDQFLDMPPGAQALYFQLGMHADDDGFVNGPKQICRMLGIAPKNLEILTQHGFLYRFDNVVVIKHWLVANTLKKDRLRPLAYPELADRLYIQKNKAYTLTPQGMSLLESRNALLESKSIQTDSHSEPKVREGKVREEKVREDKIREDNAVAESKDLESEDADSQLRLMGGELGQGVILLSEEQVGVLLDRMGLDAFDYYVKRLSGFILKNDAQVKNHYETILKWWEEDGGI